MKLQFDPNQQFQLDAVSAVADLFEGQPEMAPQYAPIHLGAYGGLFEGQESSELGVGNRLLLSEDVLRDNTRGIQQMNDIEVTDPTAALESWTLFDRPADAQRAVPHFSVEMETGTGKTYVYLRTIHELSKRYGFKKFVIVVPSVAIREGVLKNLQITADHFRALYNEEARYFVYDAKRLSRLREFATANTLQIHVINIQAFVQNLPGGKQGNVIYKESDKLSGRQPIEYVQAARPIVIIDEPQSVDSTEKSQDAIKELNPLVTLRYSATHRNPYNLVYRLDPIRAFELKLVKQIVVASATVEGTTPDAFVRVEDIRLDKGLSARLRINVQENGGPKQKSVTVKQGYDLHMLSNERPEYAVGYSVAEINAEPGREYVRFANGKQLSKGGETGGVRDDVWRAQIKHTVKRHLDTELLLQEHGIKVLSLFFIDRVANYRQYTDDGQPAGGKFATAFEEVLSELAASPVYQPLTWLQEPVSRLHNGYFAQDKKGVLKDTSGQTQADDDA
jgi:type III restriction enzyme